MDVYGGVKATDVGEWLGSNPSHFTTGNRASATHWIGGYVGPSAVLVLGDKKFS